MSGSSIGREEINLGGRICVGFRDDGEIPADVSGGIYFGDRVGTESDVFYISNVRGRCLGTV
jgi:hypothetical protein